MAKKALCLSGGGARGSFQIGAIKCLYEVYGFRPDVIAGTSVGAVNGIKLAAAPPQVNNDSESILIAVRNGQVDKQLERMRELEQLWLGFLSPTNFFAIRAPFKGTPIENAIMNLNFPSHSAPLYTEINSALDMANVLIALPLGHFIAAGLLAGNSAKIKDLIKALFTENALLELTPIQDKLNAELRDSNGFIKPDLTNGTPLYLAMVSLETGKLRYVTNKGEFYEKDAVTPVATALMDSDIDAALYENLVPLETARKERIKYIVARYKGAVNQIAAYRAEYNVENTTWDRRRQLAEMIQQEASRGTYYAKAAKQHIQGIKITAKVDPILGVLGSACMPVYFNPPVVGVERYVDGGIREIVPVEVVLRHHVDQLIGIVCSVNELPETDSMEKAGLMGVAMRSLIDITLKEVVVGDLRVSESRGIDVRYITPAFDVHDTIVVQPSLIEISMHYGWLRAVDEMHPADEGEREQFRRSSELLSRMRLKCLEVERRTKPYLDIDGQKRDLFELRIYRWAIMHILAKRNALGLPAHPTQPSWSTAWEREFRGSMRFNAGTVWGTLESSSADKKVVIPLWPASDPGSFEGDGALVHDVGSDRTDWIVRGAIFEEKGGVPLASPLADILVPNGTHQYLPRIPQGMHLMAETQDSSKIWLVGGGKKYLSPTSAMLARASHMSNIVATVPRDGMAQIPDGGVPSFLAFISVVDGPDNLRPLSEVVIEKVEQSDTTSDIYIYNRSADALIGFSIVPSFEVHGGVSVHVSVESAPASISPNTIEIVTLRLHPIRTGEYKGSLQISSSDPVFPSFAVGMKLKVLPLGNMAELGVSPSSLEIDARVGSMTSSILTVTNVGRIVPKSVRFAVEPEAAQSLFILRLPLNASDFSPGRPVQLPVFFSPLARGRYQGELVLTAEGMTSNNHPYQRSVRIPLVGNAKASKITLNKERQHLPDLVRPTLPVSPPPVVFVRALVTKLVVQKTSLTIDIGTVNPPKENAVSFFIGNLGNLPLQVTALQMRYTSVKSNSNLNFPMTIPPDGEAKIELDLGLFQRIDIGRFTETIRIECDDPVTPQAAVILQGVVPGPKCRINPEFLDFKQVAVNTSIGKTTTFENVGTVDLNFKLVWKVGRQFNVLAPLQTKLLAGNSTSLEIKFLSDTPGFYSDTLFVKTAEGIAVGLVVQGQAV